MSHGSEFHRSDAATGKECRPMVRAGKVAQAAAVMKNEVGDDRVGRRRKLASADTVALVHVNHFQKFNNCYGVSFVVCRNFMKICPCILINFSKQTNWGE